MIAGDTLFGRAQAFKTLLTPWAFSFSGVITPNVSWYLLPGVFLLKDAGQAPRLHS